jgi:hypothetical protein
VLQAPAAQVAGLQQIPSALPETTVPVASTQMFPESVQVQVRKVPSPRGHGV